MLRQFRILLCAMLAVLAAACSKGGGTMDSSVEHADLRTKLATILTCGVRDDVNTAAPLLALQEYEIATAGAKPRNVRDLTAADRAELTKACFSQVQGFARATKLEDAATIQAAIAAGSIKMMPKLNLAEMSFAAPRADGKPGQLRYRAKFAHQADHEWRMYELQEMFN